MKKTRRIIWLSIPWAIIGLMALVDMSTRDELSKRRRWMDGVQSRLKYASTQRWTSADHLAHWAEFLELNPELKPPTYRPKPDPEFPALPALPEDQ